MKKLFSLCLTTLLFMSMFVVNASAKTVLSVEKKWAAAGPGASAARQGFGMDGALYYHKAGDGVYKVTSATDAATLVISQETTGIGAHAIAKDDAGNIVLFGDDAFPPEAATGNFIYILKKGEATGTKIDAPELEGFSRTDFIAASGDVFGEEGGHLYLITNNGAAAYDVLIKNGAASVTKLAGMTLGAQQNCMMLKEGDKYYYASASKGIYEYDGTTATLVDGLTDLNNQCLGATKFTLAGKEIFVYHVGSNYTSEFKVFNKTDNEFLKDTDGNVSFAPNDKTKSSGGALRGVWTNVEKVDDNNVMLYVWHSHDGGAVYQISVAVTAAVDLSCDENQGTVTGGGDIAVGANATVEATPKPGYEFVAWKKGEEVVSNDAKYIFQVTEDIALTAVFEAKENVTITLAVNDAELGAITMPEGIQLGANSVAYGTPLELTAVPAEGVAFMGWFKGEDLYSAEATIKLNSKESISLTAKFVKALVLAYELNGGVANDYKWYTPSDMFADFMFDAQGKAAPHTLEEYLAMPEKLGDPGICSALTTPEKAFANAEKWGWLQTYIASVHAAQAADGASALPDDGAGAAWRYAVGAFFIDGQREGWPKSANFATCGVSTIEAYQKVWKHGFANPTEVTAEFTLNAPYQAGFTFDGWYPDAEFAGEKVLKVAPESKIEGNKLYAKWVEYIPTLAEVIAMANDEETNARGVVTYINNKNAYIQDASAGMLLFCKAAPTFKVGDLVVVKGTRTVYGGAPELKDVVEVRAEASTMPKAVPLASLAAATADPLKYFGQLVAFNGLKITALDNYKNPSLTDGVDTVVCYKMSVDETKLPVGTVVNVTAIAGYFNGFQLVGDPAGIVEAGGAAQDSYKYPAYGEKGEYTLTNKWIYSNIKDNYASAMPSQSDFARGMVAKDGKMYFINRVNGSFTVVDGSNGKKLDPIQITGEHLFEAASTDAETGEETWGSCATLAYNDVKLDQAGHFLIGGCVSGGQRFQVYKVDIATGAATEVVNDRLYDYPDFELEGAATAWRFDAFNVYGDVDSKAIIMAADANSFFVYYWEINNGKAGEAQRINCTPEGTDVSLIVKDGAPTVTAFGTAPQIFPIDFDYFYVDGWNTLPMLFDMDGTLVQDFATVPTGVKVGMPGDTCTMNTGHNGLCEFQVGEEYYLVMAATNTVGSPTSAFALYKFADENRDFKDMTPLWFFPVEGMGAATNGCRTAVPSVEVNGDKATIYVYTNNNGYGVYEMSGVATAIENINSDAAAIKAEKRIENGMLYIIRNGVRYNAQGVVAQ
ncbi:MAG: InlB B-repeat-containing protein [Paludibacteraceae bacterium]|nr:InlB B-repeat-containing protein [Paludibacteraceae bacterium]